MRVINQICNNYTKYLLLPFYRHKKTQVVLIVEVVEVGGDRDQAADFKPGLISAAEFKTQK